MITFIVMTALNISGLFFIYYLVRREIKRTVNPRDILKAIEADINSVLTELNNTTDRNVTIIEEATEHLKKVIEDADKRIRILEKAGGRKQGEDYSFLKSQAVPIQIKDPAPQPVVSKGTVSNKEKVLTMYRQGFNAGIIAQRLEMPLGEVELIISITGA
ncbi:MAG: hypothetical protein JXB03_05000 [Spirochaetales bacterium]|nr:hypothetical protein [Spirochaetales bacterium]